MLAMSSLLKKRSRSELDEEQELIAAFIMYAESVKRVKEWCFLSQTVTEKVISSYVKHRGGIQEVRVYEIPNFKFDPYVLDEKYFVQHFRFTHAEMDRVVLSLLDVGFPLVVKTKTRDKCSLYDALCMLCFKFAWPMRLGTMVRIFFSSTSRMSRIISSLRSLLFKHFSHHLKYPKPLSLDTLETYCAAVKQKSGLSICFGFIDGTVRPVCKPSVLQGSCYNGKDRVHALKYQALTNARWHVSAIGRAVARCETCSAYAEKQWSL
jgi:hypothetical protein